MEILDTNNNLIDYLSKLKGKKITIVTAFASGTESIIRDLIGSNDVELIVGSINSFSSPIFIEAMKEEKKQILSSLWIFVMRKVRIGSFI